MGPLSLCRLWAALLLPVGTLAAPPADPPQTPGEGVVQLDIRPQPLAEALTALADQADLQILFTSESVQGLTAPAVTGAMSPEKVIDFLVFLHRAKQVFFRAHLGTNQMVAMDGTRYSSLCAQASRTWMASGAVPRLISSVRGSGSAVLARCAGMTKPALRVGLYPQH